MEQSTLLSVHQGYELYGSDRSFVTAIEAIADKLDVNVNVLLPRHGPIDEILKAEKYNIIYRNIFVLRKADIIIKVTAGIFQSLFSIYKAVKDVKRADITYVNTAVILDFMLAGWLTGRPLIVHVREIPTGVLMRVIRRLLIMSRATLIYNSEATRASFAMPSRIEEHVVWNGFQDPGESGPKDHEDGTLKVLCVGRINSWKGQDDLISAASMLPEELRKRIRLRILGSVYENQGHFLDSLKAQIKRAGLVNQVELLPFVPDPSTMYRWADVVAVPSKKPEPFGRVAIEAMAFGCAVVGTAAGGLTEIIVEGETGLLVPLSNPPALSKALATFVTTNGLAMQMGIDGRRRFLRYFTEQASAESLVASIVEASKGKIRRRA